MVGPAFDCISNPLGAVRMCFDSTCTSFPPSCSGDFGVQNLFRRVLLENGGLARVPEVNSVPVDAIPANCLVRFRGMVQDMFDMEFYVGAYKDGNTWRTNKYSDVSSLPMCSDKDIQIWERRPYYCVPVSGENSWVKSAFATREFEVLHPSASVHTCQSQKRSREAYETGTLEMMETDGSASLELETNGDKRQCYETSLLSDPDAQANHEVDLNVPVVGKQLVPCLVKVYEASDAELKLNDVVEFVGIFTYDLELSRPRESGDVDPDSVHKELLEDDVSAQLSASKVPRLHCIFLRKLSNDKLFSTISDYESAWASANIPTSAFKELRDMLLNGLRKVLAGDGLAAEYLLLHLLSRVHARVEPMAVGKLSLNISNWNDGNSTASCEFSNVVVQTIAALVPCSHLMPLSLEHLNKSLFAPWKDYKKNRLITGDLQLADGTRLILDETAMTAGQLTETGVRNVHSLRSLMEWQKVEYDFQFYKMDMPADIPVLVLSAAKSRLFPADVAIPLQATANTSVPLLLDDQQLLNLRWYLSTAKAGDHTIEPHMQKVLEEELVCARQQDRSLGTEAFHRWLTLARLMSLSFGESTLTMERWEMVRELERNLSKRCATV